MGFVRRTIRRSRVARGVNPLLPRLGQFGCLPASGFGTWGYERARERTDEYREIRDAVGDLVGNDPDSSRLRDDPIDAEIVQDAAVRRAFSVGNETSLWWRHYPRSGCPHQEMQLHPEPHQKPVFTPGDTVRLKGKPDRARRVVSVEWHCYCHEFVYIVETSTHGQFASVPYWFASQLVAEDQWQREQEGAS